MDELPLSALVNLYLPAFPMNCVNLRPENLIASLGWCALATTSRNAPSRDFSPNEVDYREIQGRKCYEWMAIE